MKPIMYSAGAAYYLTPSSDGKSFTVERINICSRCGCEGPITVRYFEGDYITKCCNLQLGVDLNARKR
jgi:hypothetical protein